MVRAALLFSAAVLASAVAVPAVTSTYIKAETPVADQHFGRAAALNDDATVAIIGSATGLQDFGSYAPAVPGSVNVYVNNTYKQAYPGTASSTEEFGTSIAISGNTVVVGAPGETTAAAASAVVAAPTPVGSGDAPGGAFIYEVDATTGVLTRQGLAKMTGAYWCGASVAIEGDTIVVGCPGYGVGGSGVGKAFVIVRAAGAAWTTATVTELTPPSSQQLFGYAVAIVNGEIFVSDPNKFTVTKYTGSGTTWTAGTPLLPPTSIGALPAWGTSLAIAGDLLVVGAPRLSSWVGAAYFYRTTATGAAAPEFTADGRAALASPYLTAATNFLAGKTLFGGVVAATKVGDLETVYVAAPGDATCGVGANIDVTVVDPCVAGSGTVFVYQKNGTAAWALVNGFKSLGPVLGGAFGSAVAVRNETLLVGASQEGNVNGGVNATGVGSTTAPLSGAAYSFTVVKAIVDPVIPGATCAVISCGAEFGGACSVNTTTVADATVVTCAAGTYPADAASVAVTCANATNITLVCVGAAATDKVALQRQIDAFTSTPLLVLWAKANGLTVAVSAKCAVQCTANNRPVGAENLKNSVARCSRCIAEDHDDHDHDHDHDHDDHPGHNHRRQVTVVDYLGRVVAVCLPGVETAECFRELVCANILVEGDDCAGTPCPDCSSSSKKGLLGLLGLLGLIPLLLCCCCLLWLCCIRRKKTDPDVHFATFDPCATGTVGCVAPSMVFPADHCVGGSVLAGGYPHGTATFAHP